MKYTITNKRNKHLCRVSTDMYPINVDALGNNYFQSSIMFQFSSDRYFTFDTKEEAEQFLLQFMGMVAMEFSGEKGWGIDIVEETVKYAKTLKIVEII